MRTRAPNGFTLLELLLAVSLLSMITASIMGGVHLGRRSWETARASEALDETEAALRASTLLIGKGFTISVDQSIQPEGQGAPIFLGGPQSCRFVALSEGGAQWGGLILTEIGVDRGSAGDELAVWTTTWRPSEGLAPGRQKMKKTVVLENLAGLRLSYFGAQQPGAAPSWSDTWNSRLGLPQLVSVTIGAQRLGRVIQATATVAIRQR